MLEPGTGNRLNGVKDTDDTVDMSNMDNYLYAEQCCALGVGYKITGKLYTFNFTYKII